MKPPDRDRSYWEQHAKRYDRSVRVLEKPMARALELTAQALQGTERVLELAAGTGLVTGTLAAAAKEVIATDYAAAMVEELERRVRNDGLANVRCERADLYALPYEPASFDAVVAANVLHLVPDFSGAVAAIRRVLRPSGLFIAPTFAHDETLLAGAVSRLLGLTGFPGKRRFSASSFRAALEAEGLSVTHAETLPGLFPIAFVAGRFGATRAGV